MPSFTGSGSTVRVEAFDPANKPTPQLLLLLKLAGENPRRIEFATDGGLTAMSDAPAAMVPLLHGWRQDERVEHLVVATVRASRDAGHAVWPPEIAAALRAAAAIGPGAEEPRRDRNDGMNR